MKWLCVTWRCTKYFLSFLSFFNSLSLPTPLTLSSTFPFSPSVSVPRLLTLLLPLWLPLSAAARPSSPTPTRDARRTWASCRATSILSVAFHQSPPYKTKQKNENKQICECECECED
jgi:hypothetical protein